MHQIELVDRVELRNTLGEGVLWDDQQQAVWWTDIHEARLHRYQLDQRQLTTYTLPERLGSFGFTERDGWLICAFASGFALYQPATGAIDWIARPEQGNRGTRFNDGRVDRQGRFWAGSMVEDQSASASGSLYCLAGREIRRALSDVKISNSICWSPDSRQFYFADSPSHQIRVFAFDSSSGAINQAKEFAQIPPPYEPDGSTVDAQGYLWNAWWGGSRVVRYSADGRQDLDITLPVSQPTCVAFGGPELNLLLVSTASVGLSAEQLQGEPFAGNLLIYRTPYRGLVEARFKI